MQAKLFQSHSILCHDGSLPDSSAHGILQNITGEYYWIAIPTSRGSSRPGDRTNISRLLLWQAGYLPLVPTITSCKTIWQYESFSNMNVYILCVCLFKLFKECLLLGHRNAIVSKHAKKHLYKVKYYNIFCNSPNLSQIFKTFYIKWITDNI